MRIEQGWGKPVALRCEALLFVMAGLAMAAVTGCAHTSNHETTPGGSGVRTTSSAGSSDTTDPVTTTSSRTPGQQPISGRKGLMAIQFVSPSTGYMVGNGEVLKTTTGGRTFDVAKRTGVNITSIKAAKSAPLTLTAWGLHTILITHDGGYTWSTENLPQRSVLAVDFVSGTEGFALESSNLWRTTNGGESWSKLVTPALADSVSFGSTAVGWIGTSDGKVFKTSNAGNSWTLTLASKGNTETLVHATSAQRCLASISGLASMGGTSYTIFQTQDGKNWKPILAYNSGASPPPGNPANAAMGPGTQIGPVLALGSRTAVVAGICPSCNGNTEASLVATKNEGASWSKLAPIRSGMTYLTSISFVTPNVGWLLETGLQPDSGLLFHTSDGGKSWSKVHSTS